MSILFRSALCITVIGTAACATEGDDALSQSYSLEAPSDLTATLMGPVAFDFDAQGEPGRFQRILPTSVPGVEGTLYLRVEVAADSAPGLAPPFVIDLATLHDMARPERDEQTGMPIGEPAVERAELEVLLQNPAPTYCGERKILGRAMATTAVGTFDVVVALGDAATGDSGVWDPCEAYSGTGQCPPLWCSYTPWYSLFLKEGHCHFHGWASSSCWCIAP